MPCPGVYWLRLYNGDGASVLRPFVVGTLPEVAESETERRAGEAAGGRAAGRRQRQAAKSGDVDGYRVELKQGQTLVASLQANSMLGAPMDAVLQVCELVERPIATARRARRSLRRRPEPRCGRPRSAARLHRAAGRRVPGAAVRLSGDARQQRRFAGGDDYLYRLTLTTGPFIDHALPLAAPSEETQVQLGGWNLGRDAAGDRSAADRRRRSADAARRPAGLGLASGRRRGAGVAARWTRRAPVSGTRSVPATVERPAGNARRRRDTHSFHGDEGPKAPPPRRGQGARLSDRSR